MNNVFTTSIQVLTRARCRPWMVAGLAIASVMVGLPPLPLPFVSGANGSMVVRAQSPQEVVQYARAAYEIEQMRRRKYAEVKKMLGGAMPGDVCQRANVPGGVRSICDSFVKESNDIVRRHGLTPAQFNDITLKKRRDPNLQQQIQAELLRLQQR